MTDHYADFGPTLATEKLAERHGLHVAHEWLRQQMIAAGLWPPSPAKSPSESGANAKPASANWCRWTLPSTTGSKAAASTPN